MRLGNYWAAAGGRTDHADDHCVATPIDGATIGRIMLLWAGERTVSGVDVPGDDPGATRKVLSIAESTDRKKPATKRR